jgi:hypothetical protein
MMTRAEKEKKAIELLKRDKSFRYVAKYTHLSLSVISALNKKLLGVERTPSSIGENRGIVDDKYTEAYQLFHKEKMPLIDVAIKLGLDEKTTTKYWIDFCKLKNLDVLVDIYDELGSDVGVFIELYRVMKLFELTPKEVKHVAQTLFDIEGLERRKKIVSSLLENKRGEEMRLSIKLDAMRSQLGLLKHKYE